MSPIAACCACEEGNFLSRICSRLLRPKYFFTCCSTLELKQAFGIFLSMSRWVWTGVVKSKVALNYALRPTECPVWSRPKSHIHHPQKTKKRPEIRLPSGTQRDARRLVHPTGVMGQYGISRWSRIGAPIDYFMNGKPPLAGGQGRRAAKPFLFPNNTTPANHIMHTPRYMPNDHATCVEHNHRTTTQNK